MSQLRVGVSGWSYPEWKGVVYPSDLPQSRQLEFLATRMNSIEINATFYKLQSPSIFRAWHRSVPDDLVFAVKGSKFITHQKRLVDVRIPLANFFASGVLALEEKLGPILWQFSPWFRFDREKVESFLKLLPRTSREAAKLAKENTIKSAEKRLTKSGVNIELRYALEPRHESFFVEEFIDLLRRYNVALAFADAAGKFGYAEDVTADFMYIRLHGGDELYISDYREAELDRWAKRIRRWQKGGEPRDAQRIGARSDQAVAGRDVFVYFDNSIEGHAAFDAVDLSRKLGIKLKSPAG
jgi:uncharacterized protein YecE (DUF72 family)